MEESRVVTLFMFCNIPDEMYMRISILLEISIL